MKKSMKTWLLAIVALLVVAAGAYYYLNQGGSPTGDLVEQYTEPEPPSQLEESYDVVVIGGEPEGVAAAVSAARNGAKTLLVEERPGLGGLMTFGMLNYIDMVQGINNKSAIGGIYKEWHNLVGNDNAFHIGQAKAAFLKLVEDEKNLTLALETEVIEALMSEDGKQVQGVRLGNINGEYTVHAKQLIDATQDADFAVLTGVPYFIGGEDIGLKDRLMAVTPMIHLRGVDWDGVKKAVDQKAFGGGLMNKTVAWGFNDLHYEYQAVEENTRLRGLNLVRIENKDGQEPDFYINALQIFGVNGLDKQAKQEALEKGKRETEHIVAYLREHFPGFEQATIASYPTELYVRETRHILAEYQLPMSDIWQHKDHWDSIGYGGYPVDVQATSVKDYGYVISAPVQYALPFRSLVPLEIENLLVVGRSAGYSSIAAGSTRIIPSGMATGEAAGAAAKLAIDREQTVRQLAYDQEEIEKLRSILESQGAYVQHFEIDYAYKGEWFDPAISFLMNYGLLVAGYENDLHVDTELKTLHFSNLLINGFLRMDQQLYDQYVDKLKQVYNIPDVENNVITRDEVARYLLEVFTEETVTADPWSQAHRLQLVDDELYQSA